MSDDIVLCTHELTKRYGRKLVVDHVSLAVRRGEIYGFLGRNGAGKTTLIRMLLGLARPSEGWVELFGQRLDRAPRALFARIGNVVAAPDSAGLYPHLTMRENIEVHTRMLGMRNARQRIDIVLQQVGLGDYPDSIVRTLSLGYQRRLALALALLTEPELLILDEPVNGIDPAGIHEIRALLVGLVRERQVTIFIASHILGEMQQMATRLGIIHQGRLIEEIGMAELHQRTVAYLELEVSDPSRAAWVIEEQLGITAYTIHDGQRLHLAADMERAAAINQALVQHGVAVRRLTPYTETLEDYFIKQTTN